MKACCRPVQAKSLNHSFDDCQSSNSGTSPCRLRIHRSCANISNVPSTFLSVLFLVFSENRGSFRNLSATDADPFHSTVTINIGASKTGMVRSVRSVWQFLQHYSKHLMCPCSGQFPCVFFCDPSIPSLSTFLSMNRTTSFLSSSPANWAKNVYTPANVAFFYVSFLAPRRPILVLYFFVLFGISMKQRIKHMIKYKYTPFDIGKTKHKGKADTGSVVST